MIQCIITQYHKAIGQIWTEMARDLADSLIIPFNISDYSSTITSIGKTFMDSFREIMNNRGIDTGKQVYRASKYIIKSEKVYINTLPANSLIFLTLYTEQNRKFILNWLEHHKLITTLQQIATKHVTHDMQQNKHCT